MADVPGEDQYEATRESLLEMVRTLVRLQSDCAGSTRPRTPSSAARWSELRPDYTHRGSAEPV